MGLDKLFLMMESIDLFGITLQSPFSDHHNALFSKFSIKVDEYRLLKTSTSDVLYFC